MKNLSEVVGKHVRCVNESYDEDDQKRIGFQIIGTLELSDEEILRYYVRVGEDRLGHGCIGVAFYACNVVDCYLASSGVIELILKG